MQTTIRSVRPRLCSLSLALVLSASPGVRADIISVNFNGGGNNNLSGGVAVSGTAGAVSASNWNNESGASGSGLTSMNSAGTATSALLTFSSANTWGAAPAGTGTSGGAGDIALMSGYLDTTGGQPPTVTVSGLPSTLIGTKYDVLIYMNADANGTRGYTVTDNNGISRIAYLDQTGGQGGN